MMNMHKHSSRKGGFTLVEMVVVLAITAIIAAVSVPTLIPWYNTYKATERQANAELIYTTAQNNMAELKAKGLLNNTETNGSSTISERKTLASAVPATGVQAAESATDADSGIVVLTNDNMADTDALDILVPNMNGQVSKVGFASTATQNPGHYYIELNATTGYVYSVFYSENEYVYADVAADREHAQNNGVGYYGGSVPTTWQPSDREPVRWLGYFEFSKTGEAIAATGGYFYQINEDNSVTSDVTDMLHTNNTISEGAVDSTDGTAYGLLISKADVNSITMPSDIDLEHPYVVTNQVGVARAAVDCVFYKMKIGEPEEEPEPEVNPGQHDDKGNGTYEIRYYKWTGKGRFLFIFTYNNWDRIGTEYKKAHNGSTVSVGPSDYKTALNGEVQKLLNNGYVVDEEHSRLTDTMDRWWTTTHLDVYLVPNTQSSGETTAVAPIESGAGIWNPWSSATGASSGLKNISFYVDQNFAGAINAGTSSAMDNTYQVRTAKQLQSINMPIGATSEAPVADYLASTFYQTHNIDIHSAWTPIGQEISPWDNSLAFTGTYYGGYTDKTTASKTTFTPPSSKGEHFSTNLTSGFSFNDTPAYANGTGNSDTGIFGYVVDGTLSYATVNVANSLTVAPNNTKKISLYGTLAASVYNGTVDNCALTIADNQALTVSPVSNKQDVYYGGLVGEIGNKTKVTNSRVALGNSSSLVGTISNTQGASESDANGNERGGYGAGGFGGLVGNAYGSASITSSAVEGGDSSALTLTASAQMQSFAGGFIARADSSTLSSNTISGIDIITVTSDNTQNSIDGHGSYIKSGRYNYSGGFSGYLSKTNAIGITISGVDAISAISNTTNVADAGGVIGALAEKSTASSLKVSDTGALNAKATNVTSESVASGGLIGIIFGGSTFRDSNSIELKSLNSETTTSKNAYSGGAVGYIHASNMTNVNAKANESITAKANGGTTDNSDNGAGGAIGFTLGDETQLASVNNVTISSPKIDVLSGASNYTAAGGFVGRSGYTTFDTVAVKATGDNALLNVKSISDGTHESRAGGFGGVVYYSKPNAITVNSNYSLIINAENTDSVSAAGGLVGLSIGAAFDGARISSVHNIEITTHAVKGTQDTGGINGWTYINRNMKNYSVHDSVLSNNDGSQFNHVGIELNAKETDTSARILVEGNKSSTSNAGEMQTGGAFGRDDYAKISNTYVAATNGAIEINSRSAAGGSQNSNTAGFAACNIKTDVSNSYVMGNLVSYVNRSTEGNSGFAGFFGWVDGEDSTKVTNCFVNGTITQGDSAGRVFSFARAIGKKDKQLVNCYAAVINTAKPTEMMTFTDSYKKESFVNVFSYDPKCGSGGIADKVVVDEGTSYGYYKVSLAYMKKKTEGMADDFGTSYYILPAKTAGNPFPTATKDMDGNWALSGDWLGK